MATKTLSRLRKKKALAEEAKKGNPPKKITEATKGHMVCGKLMRMRHGLKKKRKYRIGTATAHDIYENLDAPPSKPECNNVAAALEAAKKRKAVQEQDAVMQLSEAPKAKTTKKIIKKTKVVRK